MQSRSHRFRSAARVAFATGLGIALVSFLVATASAAGSGHWRPAPRTAAWQWQLQGKLDPGVAASVYDVDGFETTKAEVAALRRRGRIAICYLDVGSWENFRSADRDVRAQGLRRG